MAWTAPMTVVDGQIFTAAQYNSNIRDNLLETAPAKATTAGGYFVATGTNAIAQRLPGTSLVSAQETTSSIIYGDLATVGPTVTVTTGTRALVSYTCQMQNDTVSGFALASISISGATTLNAADTNCIAWEQDGTTGQAATISRTKLITVNPGVNTFTLKYRALTAGTADFSRRELVVIPF